MKIRKNKIRQKTIEKGWTLIELTVVIAIVIIIVSIAIAALSNSKSDASSTAGDAEALSLNQAIDRAYLKDDKNPTIYGPTATNGATAKAYLVEQGYLRRR